MRPQVSAVRQTVESLASFADRGAGTDAERRAASWLAEELRRSGREATIETFWCRPNWPLAHAWHVALGVAGSLVAVSAPKAGAGMVLAALLCVIVDWVTGWSPGRSLTPERASQNIVSPPRSGHGSHDVRLVVTAALDAGRRGLVHRGAVRRHIDRITSGRAPGWLGWLTLTLVWTLATALLRVEGDRGTAVSVAQLIPTVALVLGLALLLELGTAAWDHSAADDACGVAVALALVRALDAAPPASVDVALVMTGAADSQGIGLRRYLRSRRRRRRADNTVILGIGPCGAGTPSYLISDGSLVPLAFHRSLRGLAAGISADEPGLELRPARGRGTSAAFPGRLAGLPAITLTGGTPDGTLQAGLLLVDAIDAYLAAPGRGDRELTPA